MRRTPNRRVIGWVVLAALLALVGATHVHGIAAHESKGACPACVLSGSPAPPATAVLDAFSPPPPPPVPVEETERPAISPSGEPTPDPVRGPPILS